MLLQALTSEAAVRDQTWDWLRERFPAYVEKIPVQWRRHLPWAAGGFCDRSRISEVDALFAEQGDLVPGHGRALAQVKESIALCAALREARGAELAAALGADRRSDDRKSSDESTMRGRPRDG